MSVNLRRAKKSDLKKILEIEKESFKEPWRMEGFLYELNLPEEIGISYVAEVDEKVGGYIFLHIFDEGIHIVNIAVRKDMRRQGIGTLLLQKAEEIAKNKNIPLLVLEVRENNLPAISLYKKHGFSVLRKIEGYYSDGENALLMVKEVNNT